MGSGKTTIGKLLAQKLCLNFVDTDHIIEIQQGMTVAEIFERHGEAAFREMEHKLLLELQNGDSAIIATGGGMPCYNDNMNIMLACGKVVYLKTSPQELVRRLILSNSERPLINGKTKTELLQYITEELSKRTPVYSRANISVETDSFPIEEMIVHAITYSISFQTVR